MGFEINRILRSSLGAAVLALTPVLAAAEMPVTYRDEGRSLFRFNAPDFWTVRAGGQRSVTPPGGDEARLINRVIGLQPSVDDGVWMGFMSPHGVRTYEDAVEYLRDIGPFIVEDSKVAERERIRIGGLPAARITGTGHRGRIGVNFTVILVDLPGNRVAISIVVLEDGSDPSFVNEINEVFASFRAVN
ncbi:MAG: hypothetical protein GJ676_04010 [Rhodobacteraceae bacterium]|nr:hypothetical protein [Paracoccaceae bacterium]